MHNLYDAGQVTRYHTIGGAQSVAEHSWGVAMLIMRYHPDPPLHLIQAALEHDLAEKWIGDVPYPTKLDYPRLGDSYKEAEQDIERVVGIMRMSLRVEYVSISISPPLRMFASIACTRA